MYLKNFSVNYFIIRIFLSNIHAFPCFSETASSQGIAVEAEFEKKYENMNLSNAKYIKLDKQFMREHITEFTECGETLKNEFITMLTEYKVPDGWTILRESGPETKHDIFWIY